MTYRGKVKNGVVILEAGAKIPDGSEVKVEPIGSEQTESASIGRELSSLFQAADRAKPTGITDLAINHDHYLYGHPKVSSE